MTDTAASIAAEVVASLAAEGIDARFTLIKTPTSGDPWTEADDLPGEYPATCQQASAAYIQRAGMALGAGETAVTVYQLAAEPKVGDKAKLFGKDQEWTVRDWRPSRFGEDVVSYTIKVAR